MTTVKLPLALVATFLWIGFVSAISFMEAWLKFQAPGITLPLGLGIGRIVFSALNRVEWVLFTAVLAEMGMQRMYWAKRNVFVLIPLVALLVQTFWLLPALDTRAQMHIDGLSVSASNLHFCFVGIEVVKVVCLALFGLSLLEKNEIKSLGTT